MIALASEQDAIRAVSDQRLQFTQAMMEETGIDAPVAPIPTAMSQGRADRPRNGVLARPRADALGLRPLRPWRDALATYVREMDLAARPV